MSVQNQIDRIKANVAEAYGAVASMGGTVPETQNVENLAAAINSIPATNIVNAPIGAIIVWSGTEETVPEGWSICNGENGTLDLRDKFVLGAGIEHSVGSTGGSETVTLTVDQMPEHNHRIKYGVQDSGDIIPESFLGAKILYGQVGISTYTGGSQPHSNMPPYYTAIYIQKTGLTPSDYATIEDINAAIGDINAILDAINGEAV